MPRSWTLRPSPPAAKANESPIRRNVTGSRPAPAAGSIHGPAPARGRLCVPPRGVQPARTPEVRTGAGRPFACRRRRPRAAEREGLDAAVTDADAERGDRPERAAATGPEAADRPRPPARRRWPRWTAMGAAAVVLAGAGVGWALYQRLEGNITTDVTTAELLERYERERPEPALGRARNILILGSDDRSGGNRRYGRDTGTARSDTTILLHLAADRKSATAVSVPRDLMVRIPACERPDGSRTKAQFAQFNWAFEFGGAACAIRTVERLTDIRVDHHVVIDFQGFKRLVDAIGGVEVCLPEPVRDKDADLDLPAGRQTLRGEDALGYVRARQSIGNGSDTQRMARQQAFLASLVKKVRSNGVLMNPTRLYPVLDAATSSITADAGLNSLTELYDLVRSVRDIPDEDIRFLTVPRKPWERNPNRDELVQPEADRLFADLRADRQPPLPEPDEPDEPGGRAGPDGNRTPGGRDASQDVCAP
ncbi:LCP family protein [Streptomyces sp. OF8]|uniref:LCP family protein n=1 Tax=Streptomyces alkaliterrae TaxID=2213162 RepID=A0A5P0YQ95_9ACTN|nr:LCP family protein [Streptomyces alkaliterrae]MQS02435.1 LytR family transcriptional regulator [Streptomyces alkaliterrae]